MQRSWRGAFSVALIAATLPCCVFLVLRFFTHFLAGVRLGFGSFGTDYDFVPQAVFSLFVWIFLSEPRELPKLEFRRFRFLFFTVAVFLLCTWFVRDSLHWSNPYSTGLWVLSAGMISGTSILCVLPAQFFQTQPRQAFVASLVAVSGLLTNHFFYFAEPFAVGAVSWISFDLLSTLRPALALTFQNDPATGALKYGSIASPNFTMAIGGGCSGLEGMALFIFIAGLMLCAGRSQVFTGRSILKFLAYGIFLSYSLNLARLVGIFLMAVFFAQRGMGSTELSHWIGTVHKLSGIGLYSLTLATSFFVVFSQGRSLSEILAYAWKHLRETRVHPGLEATQTA